jgi:2,4-dienoyl-CoA reductase-like NADH-dependent reductase (Old Yellow Enzyme family)
MELTKVFEPIQIGDLEIPCRIVRAAHGTGLGNPPTLLGGADWIAYHEARARGGVGLTILEAARPHAESSGGLGIADESAIPGYKALRKAVEPYGMRLFQQLSHSGNIYPPPSGVPWGVSTVPSPWAIVAEPMTVRQIAEVVEGYAHAARCCVEGGLDGVEVHLGHGYLTHQFLSPIFNTRTDEYGGSLENRMRFTQEVLRAIRGALGDEIVLGVRASASEMPGNVGEQDMRVVIRALEAEGLIDFLDCSFGDHFRNATVNGGMEVPAGYELPSVTQFSAGVSVPRIVNGRFRTLEEAEQVIVNGDADMVSMVRAHIADPAIVRKTREGRTREIRPCIACNQGCNGGLARIPPRIGCAVNVTAGFESTLSEDLIEPVSDPQRVLVVGGGPAGLEAARVAALRGHRVTLVEAAAALGGGLRAARLGPRTAMIGEIVDWFEVELGRLGVAVQLNTRVSAQDVRDRAPDTAIIATGSTARMDGLQQWRPSEPARGVMLPHVLSSVELLQNGVPAGARSAVVLDTVGSFEAITAAEALVDRGLALTFVTSLPSFGGPLVQGTQRDVPSLEFLCGGSFELRVRHHLVEVGARHCVVRPLQGARTEEVPADVVVLVTPNQPNREIHDELIHDGSQHVLLIGDARSPRDMYVAISEGHHAARNTPSRASVNA